MNKCDLQETKKQVNDIITAAIRDSEGWVWHNGRSPLPPRDYTYLYLGISGEERKTRKQLEDQLEAWKASRDRSGFYHDRSGLAVAISGNDRWFIYLNGTCVGEVKKGTKRFAFFKELLRKKKEDDECQRLLAAMNPKKKEETPPQKEVPMADDEVITATAGRLDIFAGLIFLSLFAVVVAFSSCSVQPKALEQQLVESAKGD